MTLMKNHIRYHLLAITLLNPFHVYALSISLSPPPLDCKKDAVLIATAIQVESLEIGHACEFGPPSLCATVEYTLSVIDPINTPAKSWEKTLEITTERALYYDLSPSSINYLLEINKNNIGKKYLVWKSPIAEDNGEIIFIPINRFIPSIKDFIEKCRD